MNQYVFLETIGQGAFGKVKLAHLKDDPSQFYVNTLNTNTTSAY